MEKSSSLENLRVLRIKALLKRERLKQKDLADAIDIEPQNLSRCIVSGKISEKMCRKIVKCFPEYRIEWLLGDDDFMTQTDLLRSLIHNKVDTAEALNQVIRLVADDICSRENIPRPHINFIPDFSQLQTMLHDYAELIISDYLKNRDHSRVWIRIDNQTNKK